MGPNFKKLVCEKMSRDAIPPGGGVGDAVKFLSDPKRIIAGAKAAQEWVAQAIAVVRTGSEPNPWKNADDEAIAGEILKGVEKKRKQ
jgi:hypothetical protein